MEASSHQIYKNDPLLFRGYVDKNVNVTTEDNNVCSGTVYTVDPVSERLEFALQVDRRLRRPFFEIATIG